MVPPTPFLPAWWRGDASEGALAPLAQALGLSTETLVHAEASISEAWFPERANTAGGWMRAIMLPCRERVDGPVVDVIAVAIDPSSDPWEHITRTPGGTAVPWGWDSADPGEVVFVDHPLDRLAMLESGVESVVCLPEALHPHGPQGGDWSILGHIEQDMAAIARVVLALRNDQSGHALEEEFARRVGRERCFRTRWSDVDVPHSTAGAWTVLRHHGRAALAEQIQTASPYPVAGVHELMDVDDRFEVLYEFGLSRGVSTGWPSLDPYYTVKPGQMTIVTGIPGHGKSNFLDALFVNLAREHAWVFGLFSPENQPIERHYAGLMEKYVGAPFDIGPTPRITIQEKNAAKSWLNSQFKVLLPDEDSGNWTIDGVLTLAKTLVYRYGIRGLIIDPWNELDHTRPSNVTETDHISASLTKIRRFARLNGVHVWVVAHPTKLEPRADGKYPVPTPYMISGGAHWRNKADNTITVYRNVGEDDDDIADIHIQKIRFKEIGRVGLVSLRCNIVCGRYVDDINQEKRRKALEKGVYIPSSDIRLPQPREYAPMRGLPLDFDGDGLPTSF
jgi:twinkle protein